MKQRIVIEVMSMADLKSRSKAMKIAVGVSGVESAAITGLEKNQVEVVGDGIDAVVLTKLIRKNVAYAEIMSVGEAKKEEAPKADTGETATPSPPQVGWPFAPFDYYYAHPGAYGARADSACNIM